jgi:hypothetical protein
MSKTSITQHRTSNFGNIDIAATEGDTHAHAR